MNLEAKAAQDKVIYQYKLLKKLRLHPSTATAHWALFVLCTVGGSLWGSGTLWIWFIGSLAGWHIAYFLITILLLTRDPQQPSEIRRYRWFFRWNVSGYLPASNVSFTLFRNITFHLLMVGIALSCAIAPWLPLEAALAVGFTHLWAVSVRVVPVLSLLRHAVPGSVIHYHANEINLYAP